MRVGGVLEVDDDDASIFGEIAREHHGQHDGDHHGDHDGDLFIRHSLPGKKVFELSFE
jgi:hypothetical protein